MKVRASVKPICQDCKIIRRGNKRKDKKHVLRVICKNDKHKQRQG